MNLLFHFHQNCLSVLINGYTNVMVQMFLRLISVLEPYSH